MNITENDIRLIAVMRRYFSLKEDLDRLRERLEQARREAGQSHGAFYHALDNTAFCDDIRRTVILKKEMDVLFDMAGRWGRGGDIDLDSPADA